MFGEDRIRQNKQQIRWQRKFTGKDFDEETGLYYFNARWYDSAIGRFTSEDPVRDGVNWFVYCANNPLVFVDPSGTQAIAPPVPVTPIDIPSQLPGGYGFDIYDWHNNPQIRNDLPENNDDWYVETPDESGPKSPPGWEGNIYWPGKGLLSIEEKWEKYLELLEKYPEIANMEPPKLSFDKDGKLLPTLPPNYKYENGQIIAPSGEIIPTIEDAFKHANLKQNASELKTIKKGTKEWDNAVKKIREGGKTNFKTETASDAKDLLKEARGNMDVRKRYTDAKYKKGYEMHPNEGHTKNAPHNDLPHIKWKDWTDDDIGGSGHIFFEKPN